MKQLSIFDLSPVKLGIYEAFTKHNLPYEIEEYKMYRNMGDVHMYYYVKTRCWKIVDLLITSYGESEVFNVYKNLNRDFIKDWFNRVPQAR